MTPTRVKTAYHEAGHTAVRLALALPVELVSIRACDRYGGVTVGTSEPVIGFDLDRPGMAQPLAFRAALERRIVSTLAGDIAGGLAPVPPASDGYSEPSACAAAAEEAARRLAAASPHARALVTESEANPEPLANDETAAWGMAQAVEGDELVATHYVEWLRGTARRLVTERWQTVTAIAGALLEHDVLDAEQLDAIVHPHHKEATMRRRKQPEPDPWQFVSSDGTPIVIPKPLTADNPRTRECVRSFLAGFWVPPSGHIARGRTRVEAGTLADRDSPLVKHYPQFWCKPQHKET